MTKPPARPPDPPALFAAQWSGRVLATSLGLGLVMGLPGGAWAACIDEDKPDASSKAAASVGRPEPVGADAAPRKVLLVMVQDALLRSNGVGAARLMAEAADQDVEEARAAKKPMAALTGSLSPSVAGGSGVSADTSSQVQARAGLSLSQTWFDGGRNDRIIDWRRQQAEAARLGLLSTQEQITLSTTSLAFERSRFRMQASVWGLQVRKMGCLVEALETIVSADKGRASELVQARKQLQMAELQQTQSMSQARQVEAKLRRIVGDGLPATDGFGTLLLSVPEQIGRAHV